MTKAQAQLVLDIIEQNLYLVLATADEAGNPWSTPVYYAHVGAREFFWVSSPEAQHSRNIAVRPTVGAVVFDSRALIGTGQGVYLSAEAEAVADEAEVARGLEVFSRRSREHGGGVWLPTDLGPDEGLLLYRLVAHQHFVLARDGRPDHRVAVPLD